MQSVELHTQKSGNTLDLVIGPQKFEICLATVSTSDNKWLQFDCPTFLLEPNEPSIVKIKNSKNGVLVDFNEVWFYHLWSVVRPLLVDSFLKTLQTISDHDVPVLERSISQHDCPFYDFELRPWKRTGSTGNII